MIIRTVFNLFILTISLIISASGCVQPSQNSVDKKAAEKVSNDIEIDRKNKERKAIREIEEEESKLSEQGQRVYTKGTYKGHKWYINERNVLHWDGKPHIPFTTNQIWIDHDKFSKDQFLFQFKYLDELTNNLSREGKTYFVLFLTHPEIKSLKDLDQPHIKAGFEKEWRKFAPAVAKEGLRAMTFYNEINVLPSPKRFSLTEYSKILNEYGRSMKAIVGDVPVILKVASDWNVDAAMAAIQGDFIDGLGGDFFSDRPDEQLKKQMVRPLRLLRKSMKSKLFWITEFSRMTGKEPHIQWPAFESKEQMRNFMEIFISSGATGFYYFDLHPDTKGFAEVTPETARWFQELEGEIRNRILVPDKKEKTP